MIITMRMHINIPENLAEFVKMQLKAGVYSSKSDLVRYAIRNLKKETEDAR